MAKLLVIAGIDATGGNARSNGPAASYRVFAR